MFSWLIRRRLKRRLNDPHQGVRLLALKEAVDGQNVPVLLIALANSVSRVRSAAARALGETREGCAVEALAGVLYDSDAQVRNAAVNALGKIRDGPAIDALSIALQRGSADVRQQIATMLRTTAGAASLEPLVMALTDGNWEVRLAAAKQLAYLGDALATEQLAAALSDSDSNVRVAAALALKSCGDARAVEPLIAALKDSKVRQVAADALGRIGDARAMVPLIELLEDSSWWVCAAVVRALQALRWEPGNARQRAAFAVASGNWDEAVREGAAAYGPLLVALGAKDGRTVRAAAEALGRLGDDRAVERLLDLLDARDRSIVNAVVVALRKLGDRRAVKPLIALLNTTGGKEIVDLAAAALAELCDTSDVPLLIRGSEHCQGPEVSLCAWITLLEELHTPQAIQALRAMLTHRILEVRPIVATALARLGEPKWQQWVKGDPGDRKRLRTSGDDDAHSLTLKGGFYVTCSKPYKTLKGETHMMHAGPFKTYEEAESLRKEKFPVERSYWVCRVDSEGCAEKESLSHHCRKDLRFGGYIHVGGVGWSTVEIL